MLHVEPIGAPCARALLLGEPDSSSGMSASWATSRNTAGRHACPIGTGTCAVVAIVTAPWSLPTVSFRLSYSSRGKPDYHVERMAYKNRQSVIRMTLTEGLRGYRSGLHPAGCDRGGRAMEGAMLQVDLWNKSVPRVELDQRARDPRLRLDRVERLLAPR